MKKRFVALLLASCMSIPMVSAATTSSTGIKPNQVETVKQVSSKQLSGALKGAHTTDIKVTRSDKSSKQIQRFTIPYDSIVGIYCGFYRPTLFNFNVGVYTDSACKNRVNGSYVSKQLGAQGSESVLELKAGTYYIMVEEIYMSSHKEEVKEEIKTTTGSSIKVTEVTKEHPDTLTNKMYMGVSYVPTNNLVKYDVKHAAGKVNITVDNRASSNTWDSDVVAVQYAKGRVAESSDVWVKQISKATDVASTDEDVTVILPTKTRAAGTKVFQVELTGEYTFMICISDGTKLQTKVFTQTVDCDPPEIEGVEDGKTYRKEISFTGKDEQNSTVTLTLNGKPYTAGTPITENGKYRAVAKDSKGNVTRCKFTVRIRKAKV